MRGLTLETTSTRIEELDTLLPTTWAAANRAAHPAIKSESAKAA